MKDKAVIVKSSANELMIGIPDILRDKNATRSKAPIWDHFDEKGQWREEYTEEGVKLLSAIRRLKPVMEIDISSRHTMEVKLYSGFDVDEAFAGIKRIIDNWEPTTPIICC